jgi:large subunit ribosomal protein L4
MELTVVNITGEDTGKKVELKDTIFGVEPNDHAIYLEIKQLLSNKRQGTHKTKERGEVTGSTKKIKRQKGTGTARAGDIKSPIFRGGGRVFGPRVRDYNFKLNKKVKKLARFSALSYKAKQNEIKILEDFNFETPKTKDYMNMVTNLAVNDKKSLLVLAKPDKNILLSSRNIPDTEVVTLSELNTYRIMNASTLLFVESSLNELQEKA